MARRSRLLRPTPRAARADRQVLALAAIIADKRQQHLKGTREWVFDAVEKWRVNPEAAKLFWLVGGGGTGKSVAAAELLARLLDKENAAAWHFCKHTEPARSAPAVLLRSLAGMLCATVDGFEDALKESADVKTDKVDELFEALIAKPLQSVEAPRRGQRPRANHRRARRAAARRAEAGVVVARERAEDAAAVDQTRRDEPRRGADQGGIERLHAVGAARRRGAEPAGREGVPDGAREGTRRARGDDGVAAARGRGEVPGLEESRHVRRPRGSAAPVEGAYDEAVRGVAGIHELEKYKERRLDLIQDETDFEKLYADAALAQTILIDALKTLPGDVSDPGVKGRGSAERKLADKYTDKNGVPHPEKFRDLARATVLSGSATDLLKVLTELDGGGLGLEIAQ